MLTGKYLSSRWSGGKMTDMSLFEGRMVRYDQTRTSDSTEVVPGQRRHMAETSRGKQIMEKGLVLQSYSGMLRPTDQKITAMGKAVCYSQLPGGKRPAPVWDQRRKLQGWSGGPRSGRKKMGKNVHCGFPRERMEKTEQTGLGLLSLGNSQRFWGCRASSELSATWPWGGLGKEFWA